MRKAQNNLARCCKFNHYTVINIFIGFEPVNIQVGEGDGVAMVCVELRSDRPTSQEEAVNIYSSDFTAVSCGRFNS